MDETILTRAKELFGETRFEEIMGELWLQRDALAARAGRASLDSVLREWENRFRRDVEEGRYCVQRNKRRRVTRFSEYSHDDLNVAGDSSPGSRDSTEDRLFRRIRRRF